MMSAETKDKKKATPPIVPGMKIKGDTIAGRYRVEKLLGSGSSGFVVAARHVYLRRRVTLKLLTTTTSSHEEAQRRYLAAAHRAATLRGHHIARVVDTGFTEDGVPFIATERLDGRTLAAELAERKQLPPTEAIRWILQACEGLAEAHSAGIIHGDLKPQNLFLTGDPASSSPENGGEPRVLKILDFGMATPADGAAEDDGMAWLQSPAYLAPEQIRDPNATDARTDVWALGIILHELIAGELPFSADTVSGMLVAVAYDKPALLSAADTPFELARVVASCLAKEPSERPADVNALARKLAPFAGKEGRALAKRVEAAHSSPPPPMTVPISGAVEIADEDAAAIAVAETIPQAWFPSAPPKTDDAEHEDAGVRRRRYGAIATVAAAGVLAIVGFLSSPDAQEKKQKVDAIEPPPRPAPGAPPPFIPPTFNAVSERETTNELVPPSAPKPTPPTPPQQPTQQQQQPKAKVESSSQRAIPVANLPTARIVPPAHKPPARPSLAVRDNPYGQKGFTHPSRLSEQRK
jgi:serine/threonine protein kinase